MNRIYRLVFNRARCVMQVASELSCAQGGGTPRAAGVPRPSRMASAVLAGCLSLGAASSAQAVNNPNDAALFDGTFVMDPVTALQYDFGKIRTWGVIVGHQADGFLTVRGLDVESDGVTLGFQPNVAGRLDVVGAGTILRGGGFFFSPGIEVGLNGTGLFNVTGGATATEISRVRIGVETGASGTVNVDGGGSQLLAEGATVGRAGTGTLNISNGGRATIGNIDAAGTSISAGLLAGSRGTVVVDGPSSLLEVTGNPFQVGDGGTGTLTVSNGGRLTSGLLSVGNQVTGTGTVTVTGTGSSVSANGLRAGVSGNGQITVRDGGRIQAANPDGNGTWLMLGDGTTGVGSLLVEGAGSTLDARNNGGRIGFEGRGELTVRGGASATLGDTVVGNDEGATGSVLVTGEGTRLETGAANTLTVGDRGTGVLEILDGADASVGNLEIGGANDIGSNEGPASASGRARISGTGTTLQVAGELAIADDNSGTLLVDNGAAVRAGSVRFERSRGTSSNPSGSSTEIPGSLTITGAGTTFETAGQFLASAHFSLTDGARLTTGSANLASNWVTVPGQAALISGPGTIWNNAGALSLNTPVDVVNGATVNTGTLDIGTSRWVNSATPPVLLAQLRVIGANSLLATTGALNLGTPNLAGDATSYLVLTDGGRLDAGGDINLRAGGGLALGAGLTLDANRMPTYAPALAAGTLDPDARLVFFTATGEDKLLLNHTSSNLVIGNTLASQDYAALERPAFGLTSVAGTTRFTGDMRQYASGLSVKGGKVVLDTDVNVKPANYDPAAERTTVQAVRVTGGQLIVNGSLGYNYEYNGTTQGTTSVEVTRNGVLGGRGTISGFSGASAIVDTVQVYDGGRIAPGDGDAATLTINGDLTFGRVGSQNSTAFFDVDVRGDGSSDRLLVSGRAKLDEQGVATTVSVNALDPGLSYQDGQQYTILTAAGGVEGTFTNVLSRSAFLTPSLTYDANNVFLRLALIGSALPRVVRSGETLTGNETYPGIEVQGGGTVSPGTTAAPIGTISATGPVSFAAGSFYDVDVRGDGTSDRLSTTGTATLSGGTVRVTALDPRASYQSGQEYTILSAAGGLSGTFAEAVSRSAFLVPTLSYGANNALLRIALATESNDGVVRSGQVLTGTGTYDRIEVQSGGTVSPGTTQAPIGTVAATGPVTFAAGAFYDVDVRGDGSSDRLTTSGTATLSGGSVRVTALDPRASYQNGQEYTILSATGGLTGRFADAVSRSAFLTPTLAYTANSALLRIALGDDTGPGPNPGGPLIFQTVARTRNQHNVAMALNTLPQSGDALALYNRLLMLSADEARSAFGSLSGEVHASARSGMLEDRFVRDGVERRFSGNVFGESNGGVSAWLDGSAVGSSLDGDGNGARSSGQRAGVLAGLDWALTDALTVGVAAGAEQIDRTLQAWNSSAEIDASHVGVYAGGEWDALSLRGGASHAWFDVDSVRRTTVDARAADRLTSRYDATATTVFAEGAWNLELGDGALSPYLAVAHTRLRTDGTVEQGGSTALRVAGSKDELLTATLGVRAQWEIGGAQGEGTRLTAGLGWQNANGELKQEHRAALLAGGDAFTVYGAPLGRNTGIAELGLRLPLTDASRVQLGLQGRFGDGQGDAGGQVNWIWSF